jgi:general secretion pathway protein C
MRLSDLAGSVGLPRSAAADGAPLAPLLAHGPDIASVVLAALLATELALLAWQFLPGVRHRTAAPAPVAAIANSGRSFDLDAVIGAHLFGTSATAEGPVAVSHAPLILTGTLAGTDPSQGWAILGETPAQARLFATGALVPGGVRLHAVYPDHVVLDRGGQLESLALPQHSAGGGGGRVSTVARPPASQPLSESVSRLIAQDPGIVGQVLRPQPVFANGQLRGFRLYPGADRSKFAKLGLEAGDLVTHVNGVPLADAQHGMEILKNLGGALSAEVTIERGGQMQTLTVDTQKIAALNPSDAPGTAAPPAPNPAPPLAAPPGPNH